MTHHTELVKQELESICVRRKVASIFEVAVRLCADTQIYWRVTIPISCMIYDVVRTSDSDRT